MGVLKVYIIAIQIDKVKLVFRGELLEELDTIPATEESAQGDGITRRLYGLLRDIDREEIALMGIDKAVKEEGALTITIPVPDAAHTACLEDLVILDLLFLQLLEHHPETIPTMGEKWRILCIKLLEEGGGTHFDLWDEKVIYSLSKVIDTEIEREKINERKQISIKSDFIDKIVWRFGKRE